MGKLIYSMNTTIDGYAADKNGNFGWGEPDEEVFAYLNDLESNVGTLLFGRKMYEIMKVWDNFPADRPGEIKFAENWKAAQKIVYSTTLPGVEAPNTTLERTFDPAAIRQTVQDSAKDFSISGPELAGEAIKAGIVDELHQYITPIVVGGGLFWLPRDVEAKFELVEARGFKGGTVLLRYKKA